MTIYSEFSHEKLWFSIAMLNYQRVLCNLLCYTSKKMRNIVKQHMSVPLSDSVHPILLAPCFCCCRTTPWETERDVLIDALDGTSKWRPCLAVAVPASANRSCVERSTLQIRCRSTKVASADLLCDISDIIIDIIVVNVVIIIAIIIAIIMQYHRMQFVEFQFQELQVHINGPQSCSHWCIAFFSNSTRHGNEVEAEHWGGRGKGPWSLNSVDFCCVR